ncbi:hypothetical protein OMO38_09060 [Chryseobacterium sp. 09-1422]|jgi:hypothetical protein|uniref:Uncharacterized protein n=1 Tax=Chryseobacterium kimseyorum TaxID=2984028 RepID=A0ABT3HY01_9FLAO|nr:hypothetical protein [Chryseobacterium kimseyorum]MCW3168677.1 hypothetical protein [Chryseobacterium kimseyorum]
MKNILLIGFLCTSLLGFGQVAIGKETVTNNSVSLEFGSQNRGIVLPWVNNTADVAGVVNGTMIYDHSDKKVKVKYATGWKDLSVNTNGTTVDPVTSVDGFVIQNSATESTDAKVAIGTLTSTPGILVLEDTDKAMVLPKVADPHQNIMNPAAGMMVYDTTKKLLAVFNGTVWSYWRP